jgi:DNA-binding Lrp family transcriptional regulator
VSNRIKRLEKYRIIQGYTAILNPALFARKETMIILLKFAPLYDNADIDKLSSHLRGSSFCLFATQMIGGAEEYDYACSLLCDTKQQFNSQLELILNTFGNLISDYQVCKSKIIKETPRVLPSADNQEVKTLDSQSEQADKELEDIQNLLSRREDEIARDIAATAGYTLPD